MVAVAEWKIYTSGGAEHPSSGSASNINLLAQDIYDSTGTEYTQNPIPVPETGTNYSFERWIRIRYDGAFNLVENIKMWLESWTPSDSNLDIKAGVTETFSDPVNTASSVATNTSADWTGVANALDLTPSGGITSSPGYSKYFVMQLVVPSTVTIPGNMGTAIVKIQYDES